jgi:multicomponent Na+:H+ antiporter subunit E
MRVLARLALLVALWLLAWGEVTLGNVLSGTAVAAALLVVFPLDPPTHRHLRVSVPGVARLAGHVAAQLVTSNLVMAREVLRPRITANPGVLAHRLETPSEEVVTLVTSVISLSPGTMTVDVDADASTIYVHFLFLDDVDQARASLARLERLVRAAIVAPDPAPPRAGIEDGP